MCKALAKLDTAAPKNATVERAHESYPDKVPFVFQRSMNAGSRHSTNTHCKRSLHFNTENQYLTITCIVPILVLVKVDQGGEGKGEGDDILSEEVPAWQPGPIFYIDLKLPWNK